MARREVEPGSRDRAVMPLRLLRRMGTLRLAALPLARVILPLFLATRILPQVLVPIYRLFNLIHRTPEITLPTRERRSIILLRRQGLFPITSNMDIPTGQIAALRELSLPNLLGQHPGVL